MEPLPCSCCSSSPSITIELITHTCTAVTCPERHLRTWHLWCRDDPTIFGYNLMNEPRSQAELYIVVRQTTDGSKIYNISYNPADDLQSWIEDMAAYVKSLDPIHLLSTGQLSSMSEDECHTSSKHAAVAFSAEGNAPYRPPQSHAWKVKTLFCQKSARLRKACSYAGNL